MTWPPPPPSSDPWASGPDPDTERDDGVPIVQPAADPLWEPLADPVADAGPEEPAEPVDQPVDPEDVVAAPVAHQEPEYAPAHGQARPHEPDTGRAADQGAPPPVVPRPQVAPPQQKKPAWLIAAAVAAVIVVGVVIWLLVPSGDGGGTAAPSTTAAPARSGDPRAETELRGLLPRGYAADACRMQSPPDGALAEASCGANSDPGGPPSATYSIATDDAALDTAFNDVVEASTIVTCPGNIQSPVHCPTGRVDRVRDVGSSTMKAMPVI